MEKPVTMPKLGMTMTEGTVLNWLYHEGDWIEKGEPLVEVMTDKVNMEVEAPFNGRLVQILAQEGDILPIGAPLATLTDDTSSSTIPVSSDRRDEQSISAALTDDTNSSAAGEKVPTTTNHTPTPVPSTPAAKREASLLSIDLQTVVQSGAKLPLNRSDILAFVQDNQKNTLESVSPLGTQETQGTPSSAPSTIRATPVAQKIAREHQLDLRAIAERKTGEKITRADVESHLTEATVTHKTQKQSPAASSIAHDTHNTHDTNVGEQFIASPVVPAAVESELIPLTPVRRLIGQRMLQSITTAPHIYLDTEIDMTEAERCRQHIANHLYSKGEATPSITAIVVRATAAALILHPEVNATPEPGALQGKDAIRRWRAVHIGIAVDTEQALLTPVIRNAHQQSLPALAQELRRLTLAARQGNLKPEELSGATFTISNLGMYGIDTFHAIIAPGQSAILAVGKVTKRSVVVEDDNNARIEIRPILKVSLSADHRVLDGASASRFLHQLKTFLEDPYLLL